MKKRKLRYDQQRDYYTILDVKTDATHAEVQRAYRHHAKKLHPDLNPDKIEWATEQFQLLNEAYAVLSDLELRREYDRLRWPFAPHPISNTDRSADNKEKESREQRRQHTDWWAHTYYEPPRSQSSQRAKNFSSYAPSPRPGAWLEGTRIAFTRPFYASVVELMTGPYRFLLILLALVIIGNFIFIVTNLAHYEVNAVTSEPTPIITTSPGP